jgi:hypothetical protein
VGSHHLASRYEILPQSLASGMRSIAGSELSLGIFQMGPDCLFTDSKSAGRFMASRPIGHQPQDGYFTGRQADGRPIRS